MTDCSEYERDAIKFAQTAVKYDNSNNFAEAILYYNEAAQALNLAILNNSKLPNINEKIQQYQQRSSYLQQAQNQETKSHKTLTALERDIAQARYLVESAFDQEENDSKEEALELYAQAADLCIQLRSKIKEESLLNSIVKLAQQSLDRAENLKSILKESKDKTTPVLNSTSQNINNLNSSLQSKLKLNAIGPLGFSLQDPKPSISHSIACSTSVVGGGGGQGGYTKEELNVLRITSRINGKEYVPFMQSDLKEKFAYTMSFTDKDGLLALSPKQKSKFIGWVRAEELSNDPQMILLVSCFSIRQTIISDCSFVASLAIAAQYERRFKQKLITSIIYPQNRNQEPIYNPCGKYMIKLHLNGVIRKIIIDDHLPMSKDSELLCSFSSNRNELWVSLLEKAYMKVMGGYDFPGSNSNIDLHALTGWIPERISMISKNSPKSETDFNPEREFDKIYNRFHQGHCLVTMATGELSKEDEERSGLVPSHAYAMLDIQNIQGKRLFQLKNPWSHMRWKGNFSEKDVINWTDSLKKALKFDPEAAAANDNGVFWIDYDSLRKFYDVIYINWNPKIFAHTTCFHQTWESKEGPKKDSYSIADNPQYRLEVKNSSASVGVWILLTRHITDKDDFANNREFITLLVYKNNGKRVHYPYDPPPYRDGVRINSPHYLVRLKLDPGLSNLFTLVISQYEKNNTIHYTLRVYSTADFKLTKVSEPYLPKYDKQLTSEWKGRSAGGCPNYPQTTIFNPTFQLKIDNKNSNNCVLIELKVPKNFSAGFEVMTIENYVPSCSNSFDRKFTGEYRQGYCYMELENIPGGIYNVRPSTFMPNQEAPFFLNLRSSSQYTIMQIN